ncbi:DEAD/DEAH box helicase [Candidatus Methylomirabilis sp.]|uniref:DEAD/DEAH box helicase n=1 Tax=Candidatus Methylomirabilis tolerans TaxID=3123416 RepID=A0AAJ1ELE6_9BACT|nr:DEAD/DEAH box helicase [Candidatus Methylomirabilis sp.]
MAKGHSPIEIGSSSLSQDARVLIDSFRDRYPFPLDPFQEEAIGLIAGGTSVIVSAPTGAGKTLIAEFAIYRALAHQHRIAYTTPIKALSNQKYADFTRQWGEETVGILTGDVKVNPRAPLVIMTTEILRNKFYGGEFEGLYYVVLDECHYMGNVGRGTVWEEIIINCPPEVQLVALSATVSNIGEIAEWIGQTHRPIRPIHHPVRPVPLQYLLCDKEGQLWPPEPASARRILQASFSGRSMSEGRDIGRWGRRGERRHHIVRRRGLDESIAISVLRAHHWLPVIYFIFSRSGCERALARLLDRSEPLLDPARGEEVEEAIQRTLLDYPSISPESDLNQLILRGLRRGAGLHHAGVLPALKRLTEVLFERGLVRIVFATETMSLGIHMPAKSVVIGGLRKRSDLGFRGLTVGELTQMAGRAGRRGIDPEGTCLLALDSAEAAEDAVRLVQGEPEPIESRFRIGYGSAALLIALYREPEAIRKTIEKSFGQFQNRRKIETIRVEQTELIRRLADAEGIASPCCPVSTLIEYRERRAAIEQERERLRNLRIATARAGRTGGRGRGRPVPSSLSFFVGESAEEGRAKLDAMALALSQMPCHRCPERGFRERQIKQSRRLGQVLERHHQMQQQLQDSYWEQFLRVVTILQHFGYLEDGRLGAEGRLIASLRHDNELLVARVAFSGLMDGLLPEELAALLSCLVEEPRGTEQAAAKLFLRDQAHLRRRVKTLDELSQEVDRVQRSYHVGLPVSMHTTYLAAAHRWASGEDDWLALVEQSFGGHEGDLIRAFRRLIDLCRQLEESPELPVELTRTLSRATAMLDRGIVLESALI